MRTLKIIFALLCILSFGGRAFAAGGTCPSGAHYPNLSTGALTATLSSLGVTSCYFISAGGLDTNTGADETHPWLHSPGMPNCASTCAGVTPTAGEGFIFRGGDTWHFSSGSPATGGVIAAAWSGSSGSPIYFGVDQAWFSGGSWARPILSGDSGAIGSTNNIVLSASAAYEWWDDFEIAAFTNAGSNTFEYNIAYQFGGDGWAITRNYFHAWVTTTANPDAMQFIGGCNACSGGNQIHSYLGWNYMNGADATPPSTADNPTCGSTNTAGGSGFFAKYVDGGTVAYNYVENVSNVLIPGSSESVIIHDNNFGYVWCSYDSTDHGNIMELQVGGNTIYNNLYHDTTSTAVWPLPLDPSAGTTDWVFNNVCWNVDKDCLSIDTQGSFPTYTANLYNNTWVPLSSAFCADTTDRGATNTIGAANVINNHCITSAGTSGSSFCFAGTSSCSTVTTLTETTNQLMTTVTAASQGYSSSQTFAFSPTLGGSTVGFGTNETSPWPIGATNDTTYACSVNGSNQVSCPARASVPRPASGAWDAGAYQYVNPAPAPAATMFAKAVSR